MTAKSKYHNLKILGFDSKKEMQRCYELQRLEKEGKISNLRRQVKFELIPHQKVDGRVVERAVNYFADFTYTENGQTVVEDVKSKATIKNPEYVIKRKLLLYRYGIKLREIL